MRRVVALLLNCALAVGVVAALAATAAIQAPRTLDVQAPRTVVSDPAAPPR